MTAAEAVQRVRRLLVDLAPAERADAHAAAADVVTLAAVTGDPAVWRRAVEALRAAADGSSADRGADWRRIADDIEAGLAGR